MNENIMMELMYTLFKLDLWSRTYDHDDFEKYCKEYGPNEK